jgi:NAD(P)-dependent dehydrogenase (short-subunit alcohol dehydrogenase family)
MEQLPALFDLSGRVALVTGGAGLLGREFSKTLLAAGAGVAIADLDGQAAQEAAASINNNFGNKSLPTSGVRPQAVGFPVDISSKDSVQSLMNSVMQEFQRLDILVNSAALDPKIGSQSEAESQLKGEENSADDPLYLTFEDYPVGLWQKALDVNLTGMFLCCQAAGRQMVRQGSGVIINICSIYGMLGPDQRIYQRPGETVKYKPAYYSVTKAGVLGLTNYLAAYYAGKNIRVNALTPGGVYQDQDDDFLQAYSSRTMLGRMAEKNELNGALLFLASDASAYMTGSNLVVDGGWAAW